MAVGNHKAWDWIKSTSDIWNIPTEDSHYLVHRWREKEFFHFLDLGCGLGRHAIQFAQNGFDVDAIDLSSQAISSLTDCVKKNNYSIKPICGDMINLPYPDEYFDCLLAYHVLSHTDSIGITKIVKEIKRVLRPGGELYITLCSKKAWSYKKAGFPIIDENTVRKIEDGPENGIPHFFADEKTIKVLMENIKIINMRHIQDLIVHGAKYESWHYFMLGEKK